MKIVLIIITLWLWSYVKFHRKYKIDRILCEISDLVRLAEEVPQNLCCYADSKGVFAGYLPSIVSGSHRQSCRCR